jgi:radical SAM protein with 4Fe4S-binding SPASM domain
MTLHKKTFSPRHFLNRFKLVRSYFKKDSSCAGFPVELAVEITNRCNANCVMCSRKNMKRPIGDMDMETFKKIIDEVRTHTELIWLHLAGEPLLHPKLFEMIAYGKKKGVQLGMSTNAIKLTEDMSKGIIDSGLDLFIISFDGATKETYEKIRRLSNFDQTLKNIQRFLELKKQARKAPTTQIQFIYMNENKDELQDFKALWKKTAADNIRFKPYFRFPDEEECLGPVEDVSFAKACFLLWRQITILWDGTVVSCCWDFLGQTPLGNIKEKALSEIWNGQEMKDMRQKHVEGRIDEIPLCKTCNIPQINSGYILASVMADDLSIKEIIPILDNLGKLWKFKGAQYYS